MSAFQRQSFTRRHLIGAAIRPLFSAWLPDTCVKFTYDSHSRRGGVLDVAASIGCIIPGVVFQVSEGGWEALDTKEGAPHVYNKVVRQCLTRDGEAHDVLTYEVQDDRRRPFVPPSRDYLRIVEEGLDEYALPRAHIYRAAENLPAQPLDAVFVYGSLMRCESRHSLLGTLKCALLAETPGTLFDCGTYPAMRLFGSGFNTGLVQGEFIRIADVEVLRELDAVEGFMGFGKPGSLFRRALIEVGMRDGRIRQAWAYVEVSAVGDNSCEIPSASWREHRGRETQFVRELVRAHVGERERDTVRAIANRGPFPPENE
jgi:gamma-glutamylcyclotransferase (GGCT)/AIG2-like uncharacterized protein YtfP